MKYSLYLTLVLLGISSWLQAQKSHQYLRDANTEYRAQDYSQAEVLYRKSLEEEPSVRASYNLGNTLYQQGRFEEAIRRFEHAIDNTNDEALQASAYHNLGNAFFETGEIEKSIEAYKSAMRIRPGDQSTRYNLAQAQQVFYSNAVFDLAVKIEAPKRPPLDQLKEGDIVAYNIKIINEGQLDATQVSIINYTPSGMTLADDQWVNANLFSQYIDSNLKISAGDSITITQKLRVVEASKPENLTNAVEIAEATNRFKRKDIDSTPLNVMQNPDEDDTAVDGDGDDSQQNQEQENEENQENEEQQDQEQQDQEQENQEQQQENEEQQNQEQQQEQQQEGEENQQEGGEPKQVQQLSADEARRLLEIIEEEELKVLKKLKKAPGVKKDKDW
jgi:uncharacterized repeat protein (TIGR01451 family)